MLAVFGPALRLHQVAEDVQRLVALRIDRRSLGVVAVAEIGIRIRIVVGIGRDFRRDLRSPPLLFASAIFPGYMISSSLGAVDRFEREPINARFFLLAGRAAPWSAFPCAAFCSSTSWRRTSSFSEMRLSSSFLRSRSMSSRHVMKFRIGRDAGGGARLQFIDEKRMRIRPLGELGRRHFIIRAAHFSGRPRQTPADRSASGARCRR